MVIAGLCTVQFLGLNIRPLLAIGGAGGIIIGLATQTLLSNAVMGVNIVSPTHTKRVWMYNSSCLTLTLQIGIGGIDEE